MKRAGNLYERIAEPENLRLLERRFKDQALLRLIRTILETYETKPGRGLPIGNLLSQHLANFYLGHLDHWIKETLRVRGYVRYTRAHTAGNGSAQPRPPVLLPSGS